jgi:hypothetical protein
MAFPGPISVVSYEDGPKLTVNDLLKDPTVIPRRMLDMTKQKFVADQLLRGGPSAVSGVAKFYSSTPLFSMTQTQIVGEFGSIPVAVNDLGQLMLTQTTKRGLGMRVSREMHDRNDVDAVNTQISQVSNTMVRDWDGVFMAALLAAVGISGQTVAASLPWSNAGGIPRNDIMNARQLILAATLPGTTDNFLAFSPDTIVLSMFDVAVLLENAQIWQPWVGGNIANLNPQVTGQIPATLFGMDAWATWHLAAGTALVMERNTVGFISDERPLEATPMDYNVNEEHWRSNVTRVSAVGIDQPYAVASITGIG